VLLIIWSWFDEDMSEKRFFFNFRSQWPWPLAFSNLLP